MFNIGGVTSGGYERQDSDWKRQADYWTRPQTKTSESLYRGVIAPGMQNYPYTGKPTDIELSALQKLQGFTGAQPAYMDQAGGALQRALTGQGYQNIVDPEAAERLYGAIQERTFKDILPQAVRSAAGEANIGGMLHSGTGQKLVTDEIGRIARALSEQLATLKYSDEQQRRDIERERESRQLTAVPQTGTIQNLQLGQMLPGLQYGGMERDIAGTQFENPLTRLMLAYLGLRGQEQSTGTGTTTGWNINQAIKGGFGMQ